MIIAVGFWSMTILTNFRIQAHSEGMGGEAVMLAVFPLLVIVWGTLGAVT